VELRIRVGNNLVVDNQCHANVGILIQFWQIYHYKN